MISTVGGSDFRAEIPGTPEYAAEDFNSLLPPSGEQSLETGQGVQAQVFHPRTRGKKAPAPKKDGAPAQPPKKDTKAQDDKAPAHQDSPKTPIKDAPRINKASIKCDLQWMDCEDKAGVSGSKAAGEKCDKEYKTCLDHASVFRPGRSDKHPEAPKRPETHK